MNAIVTVIGQDQVGIVAQVSRHLADQQINILDISQTLMQGNFVMTMLVAVPENTNFPQVSQELGQLGQQLGLEINMRNAKIYDAMHNL